MIYLFLLSIYFCVNSAIVVIQQLSNWTSKTKNVWLTQFIPTGTAFKSCTSFWRLYLNVAPTFNHKLPILFLFSCPVPFGLLFWQ